MKKLLIFLIFITVVITYGRLLSANELVHGGDIIYTKPVKSVIFSHKVHVEDRGLSCDNCHDKLFVPEALNAEQKNDFNMESLYKGKYCGACHDGKTAFASNTQCARCHAGVKGYVEQQKKGEPSKKAISGPTHVITIGSGDSSVKFSHEPHGRSFMCKDCHINMFPMKSNKIKITMDAIYKGQYCGSCHNGKKAFASAECNKCHAKVPAPDKDLAYAVKGFSPVNFSHKFHTSIFSCDRCHLNIFKMKKTQGKMTMDAMDKGKFCGSCHNGKMASNVMDCAKCHKG